MSTYIVALCDRCGIEIVKTQTTMFLELKHGEHRLRSQVDLCGQCKKEFDQWLGLEGGK